MILLVRQNFDPTIDNKYNNRVTKYTQAVEVQPNERFRIINTMLPLASIIHLQEMGTFHTKLSRMDSTESA